MLVADYFVREQGFDAHFICPDNLFQAYDGEQARLHEYGNINELRGHLRAIDPEFVVFASGYLLCHHGLLAQEEFTGLLDELRQSGIGAMATDTWMRSWSDEPGANGFSCQVHSRFLAVQRAWKEPWKISLRDHSMRCRSNWTIDTDRALEPCLPQPG